MNPLITTQMKKHYFKFCSRTACLVLTTTLSLTSITTKAQDKLYITPELLKTVIQTYSLGNFKIYPVTSKEIDYYPDANNTKNNSLQQELKQYKPAFDRYQKTVSDDSIKHSEVQNITRNIDIYLSSSEKSEIKDKYLIEAQSIADSNDIIIRGESSGLLNKVASDYGISNNSIKTFRLYNGKKSASKKDIEFYREEIKKLQFEKVEMSNNVRYYIELLDKEKANQKNEVNKTLSDKASKKIIYSITETPLESNVLVGKFTTLPEKYALILEDASEEFVKNELTTDNKTEKFKSKKYPMLKKSDTNELFFIMSDGFINGVQSEITMNRYLNMSTSTEYKNWKAKYLISIQSAQLNVNACKAIISKHTYVNKWGEKLYDPSTFTKSEKITFNKNLDALNSMNKQIGELESNQEMYLYYADKATNQETTKSYNLSSFFNSTSYAN